METPNKKQYNILNLTSEMLLSFSYFLGLSCGTYKISWVTSAARPDRFAYCVQNSKRSLNNLKALKLKKCSQVEMTPPLPNSILLLFRMYDRPWGGFNILG